MSMHNAVHDATPDHMCADMTVGDAPPALTPAADTSTVMDACEATAATPACRALPKVHGMSLLDSMPDHARAGMTVRDNPPTPASTPAPASDMPVCFSTQLGNGTQGTVVATTRDWRKFQISEFDDALSQGLMPNPAQLATVLGAEARPDTDAPCPFITHTFTTRLRSLQQLSARDAELTRSDLYDGRNYAAPAADASMTRRAGAVTWVGSGMISVPPMPHRHDRYVTRVILDEIVPGDVAPDNVAPGDEPGGEPDDASYTASNTFQPSNGSFMARNEMPTFYGTPRSPAGQPLQISSTDLRRSLRAIAEEPFGMMEQRALLAAGPASAYNWGHIACDDDVCGRGT